MPRPDNCSDVSITVESETLLAMPLTARLFAPPPLTPAATAPASDQTITVEDDGSELNCGLPPSALTS